MNLFKRLFKRSPTLPKKLLERKEIMVGGTSFLTDETKSNLTIYEASEIPAWVLIGNLNFDKKYHEAIEESKKLLAKTPYSPGVHINLMVSYFKIRNESLDFYEKHIKHARLAMLYGHNTGYAQKSLAIALEKQKRIYQALQVCDIVLSEEFSFSTHGCGDKVEFARRKKRLLKKTKNITPNEDVVLFTDYEISIIIEQSRMKDRWI